MDKWFFEKYNEGLALSGRYLSMEKALELFLEKRKGKEGGIIVETGSVRMENDWGGGMSTVIFGDVCKTYNHHLFTCDNDPTVMETCEKLTKDYRVFISYVIQDSVAFLKGFNQTIDLLYLDSMDCPEYDSSISPKLLASQAHQLNEMEAAMDKLSDDPVILLDDNLFENGGKTRLTKLLLKDKGFTEIFSGKQSLWIKK